MQAEMISLPASYMKQPTLQEVSVENRAADYDICGRADMRNVTIDNRLAKM
jgi:hypothetical protein